MAFIFLSIVLASPAFAADRPLQLTIDGRPVSRNGSVALFHRGVAFANLIELVRSYGGLVSIATPATSVTIRSHSATFVPGSPTATIDTVAAPMPAPAFFSGGVLYVPLAFFVSRVAGGTVRIDTAAATANIAVRADAAPDATASP